MCVLGRGVILGYQGGLDVLLMVSEEELEVGKCHSVATEKNWFGRPLL